MAMWRRWILKWNQIRNDWKDYPWQPGRIWNKRYKVERFLGMGSYGQAYLCSDLVDGGMVLLKRNKPSKGDLGRQLLRRESEMMQVLSHRQIPAWLGYSKRGNDEALIMEMVHGHNLEFALHEQGRRFTWLEGLKLLEELLSPIIYLHAKGLVHRDVRIPNVLLEDGVPKLVDFGLACRLGERLPKQLRLSLGEMDEGLPDGMGAIKQRMRKPEPSSDWFGLGHLYLFMMYADYEHPEGQAEGSWEDELKLPEPVRAFVGKLLNDDTAWQTTEQCRQELNSLIALLAQNDLPAQKDV
ncbi:serine/threonine protein kinase [Paenibacillus sp. CAU 1782]